MAAAPPTTQGRIPVKERPKGAVGFIAPVDTSPWAMVAGYVAIFSLLLLPGPFAVVLGVVALRHCGKNPHLRGKIRAWFAISFGGLMTFILAGTIVLSALN